MQNIGSLVVSVAFLLLSIYPTVMLSSQPDTSQQQIVVVRDGKLFTIDAETGEETPSPMNREDWYLTSINWSKDGSRMAFSVILPNYVKASNDSDIFVANADGSNPIQITEDEASNIFPVWSPDGQKIAFASNRSDNWDVYIMSADGTNVTNLTQNDANDGYDYHARGSSGMFGDITWSPDGQQIAFVSDRGERISQDDGTVFIFSQNIFLVSVSEPDEITNLTAGIQECGAGQFFRNLVWSPVDDDLFFAFSCGNWNVYRLNIPATLASLGQPSYTKLTNDFLHNHGREGLDVSRDGRSIVFISSRADGVGSQPQNVFVLRLPEQASAATFSEIEQVTNNDNVYRYYTNSHWYGW